MTDLGTLGGSLSISQAINESSQITGGSSLSIADYSFDAFLYDHGTMYDLNHLVTNFAGTDSFSSHAGYGINNHGQIGGDRIAMSGNYLAFLATPNTVPLPSSAALLSLGLMVSRCCAPASLQEADLNGKES
jgi:uncharacterized membrane protein